ncbi:MAG: AbrB/MazE/SpoVT family DNA-binding domain-containing protein [Methylophilaceae bacterium]
MQTVSKLTSKYQATIPQVVREALSLNQGDTVAFDIADGVVRLRRASPVDLIYAQGLSATLEEWHSPADDKAYSDL